MWEDVNLIVGAVVVVLILWVAWLAWKRASHFLWKWWHRHEFAHYAEDLDRADPYEFEEVCANICRSWGWKVRNTPDSGDFGRDVAATDQYGDTWTIQCKHYSSPIGPGTVLTTAGSREFWGDDKAMVMASNTYTRAAEIAARRCGVVLVDQEEIEHHLVRLGKRGGQTNAAKVRSRRD